MKLLTLFISMMLLCLSNMSCNFINKVKQQPQVADQDSLNIEQEKNFTTPDQMIFSLHGHVKSVIYNTNKPIPGDAYNLLESPHYLNFSEDGKIIDIKFPKVSSTEQLTYHFDADQVEVTRYSDQINIYTIIRDSNQQMVKWLYHPTPNEEYIIANEPDYFSYTIKWTNDGRIYEFRLNEDDTPFMKIEFDAQQLPHKAFITGYVTHEYTFDYLEFDKYGNWTKRNVTYYYQAVYDGETDEHDQYTETRRIEYYPSNDTK